MQAWVVIRSIIPISSTNLHAFTGHEARGPAGVIAIIFHSVIKLRSHGNGSGPWAAADPGSNLVSSGEYRVLWSPGYIQAGGWESKEKERERKRGRETEREKARERDRERGRERKTDRHTEVVR